MHAYIFSLLLIALPTQLGYHMWPSWSLVLGRRVDYLSPTVYLTDCLIILLALFWRPKHIPRITIPLLIFAAVNTFFATNKGIALYAWMKVFEYGYLGLYISQTKMSTSRLGWLLGISVLYSSVIALIQFVLQHSIGGPLWLLGERTFTSSTPGIAQFYFYRLLLRAYATFPHPNVLGGYIAILLPAIIASTKNKKSILYWAICVFGVAALIVTFSRSALIGFVVSLLVFNKKYIVALSLLTLILIVGFALTTHPQDESLVVRSELAEAATKMVVASPIVGVGLGNFLVRLPDHLVSRRIYFLQPVHNIFFLVLSETGIIGLAGFCLLFWKHRYIRLLLPVILIGCFDHYFLTLQQGQLLLTILLSSTIGL